MKSPTMVNEVQQLIDKTMALSRFISKAAQKSFPLYSLLRKGKNFEWTQECEEAFQQLKEVLATPLILA